MKRIPIQFFALSILILTLLSVRAEPLLIPNEFGDGKLAFAGEVNANFIEIVDRMDPILDSSVTISGAGFRPGDDNQSYGFNDLIENGRLEVPGTGGPFKFYAPLPIPAGARILSLEALVFDSTPNGRVEIALVKTTSATPEDIARINIINGEFNNAAMPVHIMSQPLTEIVEAGPNPYYFLEAIIHSNAPRDVGLHAVTIFYDYLDPPNLP